MKWILNIGDKIIYQEKEMVVYHQHNQYGEPAYTLIIGDDDDPKAKYYFVYEKRLDIPNKRKTEQLTLFDTKEYEI